LARPARAQDLVTRADSLRLAGRVFDAESLYYLAVRRDPRDPAARLALGRYLAERGALKIGAVLMEEARYFGGDAKRVAQALAPVYARMGEYGALAALPASNLSYGERIRAEWLRDNPPAIAGSDSSDVPYHVSDSELLGSVSLKIGDESVFATIDARAQGLVLDTSWVRHGAVKIFTSRGERSTRDFAGVTLKVRLGELTLTRVPTRFAPRRDASKAVIGLDLLGKLAPTFDPRTGRLRLRKSGRIADATPGVHIATLTNGSGVWVVKRHTTYPLGHPEVQRLLRTSRWTLNPRRGEVVVEAAGDVERRAER
jgi:hypothetical protein